MSTYIKRIRTESGDMQIDYNALANLPDLKNMFSNPNLLINSDFRSPVNQRGKTTLTTNDNEWSKFYFIDRWYAQHGATVELLDGYVKASASSTTTSGYFCQVFERALSNDTYTATINVKSVIGTVNVYLKSGDNPPGIHLTQGINVITADLPIQSIEIQLLPGSSIELYWAKLEQSSIATPFVPRLYAEELMLCMRYYQRYASYMLFPQFYENQYHGFYFRVPLRVSPHVANFIASSTDGTNIIVGASVGGHVEVDTNCVRRLFAGNDYKGSAIQLELLELDAEIN